MRAKRQPKTAATARVLGVCGRALIPIVLLSALAVALLYVRLLNGPIALTMVAAPIARSLSAELGGYSVTIDDAIVRMTAQGGLEFRLRNVRLVDPDARALAIAPLAAVSLSMDAMRNGRFAAERVVLIEPQLLAVSGSDPEVPTPVTATGASKPGPPLATQPVTRTLKTDKVDGAAPERPDMARLVFETLAGKIQDGGSASYLKSVGLRQATIAANVLGHPHPLVMASADIDLEQHKRDGTISGSAVFDSSRGPVQVNLVAQSVDDQRAALLTFKFVDVVPASLGSVDEANAPWRGLDVPLTGMAEMRIGAGGAILAARATIDLGAGTLGAPPRRGAPPVGLSIDGGQAKFVYDPLKKSIVLESSRFHSAQSYIVLQGATKLPPNGTRVWTFQASAQEGAIGIVGTQDRRLPLETFAIEGAIDPSTGGLLVRQGVLKVGGAEISGTALLGNLGAGEPQLDVRIGAMPLATLKALWPAAVASLARDWVLQNVIKGRVTGGTLRLAPRTAEPGGLTREARVVLALETADTEVVPFGTMPPIEAPRALVRLEGRSLEIAMPEGSMAPSPGRRLTLRSTRFLVADIDDDHPVGELTSRFQGPSAALLGILDREPIGLTRQTGQPLDTVDGKVDGNLKVVVPLQKDVAFRDVQIESKARLTDVRAKSLIGGYDIQAGTINFDVSDEIVSAKGDILVSGVNAQITLQHLLRAPNDRPQLRLTATLDANDRTQLGLDVNHIISGDVPIDISVARSSKGEAMPRVLADLTNAEINLEQIAWTKASGRIDRKSVV